jgi:hypothetical protein
VLRLTVERNAELAKLGSEQALSVEEVEASVVKSLALYAALDFQARGCVVVVCVCAHVCVNGECLPQYT